MTEIEDKILGKLLPLLSQSDVQEVSVESYHEVYVRRSNGWSQEVVFNSKAEYQDFVTNLKNFFKIEETEVTFSKYISEVLSVAVVLPPLAFKGPSLRILKLPKRAYSLEDYIKWNAIDERAKKVLEEILKSKRGIVCAGNFGSGKTTLFNILLNSIPKEYSITSIETSPDIVLQRDRVCRLTPRGSTDEDIKEALEAASLMGGGYITLSWMSEQWVSPYIDLLKNNSCGICVAGGISPNNVVDRMIRESVVSSNGYNLEEAAINIAEVFKYLVFQEKDKVSGRRFVSSVSELELKGGELILKDLYSC